MTLAVVTGLCEKSSRRLPHGPPQSTSRPTTVIMPRPRRRPAPERSIPGHPWIRTALALFVLPAVCALWLAADWWNCLPEGQEESASYVGREVCGRCHEEELQQWTGSDHDLAMDHATSETVLGNFDDQEFTHIAVDDVAKLRRPRHAAP